MRAVVFIVALALWTFQASPNLSANTDAIADLDIFDCGANLDGVPDNFMTDANR